MRPDLMAGLRDLTHLLGKRLDRMAGDEPGSFDLVALVQAQQPWGAHLSGEKAARNIERRILAAVGAEPARDRVDVDAEAAENLFIRGGAHGYLLTRLIARGRPRPAGVAALVGRLRQPGDLSFPLSKNNRRCLSQP